MASTTKKITMPGYTASIGLRNMNPCAHVSMLATLAFGGGMGIDRWRTEADWPLPDTHYRPYYLHSAGSANTLHGDGILSAEPPGDESSDVILYNPLRPVPTVGGQVILPGANAAGPRDQR